MMTPASPHVLHILLNAADFLAWSGTCGMVMVRSGLVPVAAFDLPGAQRAWRTSLLALLAVLMTTGIALLVVRTLEMSDLPAAAAMGALPMVLLHTHFGQVWSMHLGLVALLAMTVLFPPRAALPVRVCLLAALALTYSAVSHAGDRGDFTLTELNDWAHVIAVSLWGGGILATLFFAFPLLRGHRTLLARSVFRLSRLAAWALAASVVTGMYNTSLRIGALDQLLATDYGRILAVKAALVAGLAAVGAFSRFFIVSRLRGVISERDADVCLGRMGRALAGDVVLIALVLAAAAMLIQGMPPSSMPAAGHMAM